MGLSPALAREAQVIADTGTSSTSQSDTELMELRRRIESLTINDLSEEDRRQLWNAYALEGNPPLIRRSIESYAQSYPKTRKILFASGHKGLHAGLSYGFE